MEITQAIVKKLIGFGFTKWALMKKMEPPVTWRTVDAWSKGEWGARKNHLARLQDLYDLKCRELKIGLYEPEKKELDDSKKNEGILCFF
jgi:hypothetical protein